MPDVYDITNGVGGLWHVHKWNDDLELNTELEDGANRYVLLGIDGLHSLPPRAQQTTPKVGRIGDNFVPVPPGGKPATYKGVIEASSEPELGALRSAMLAAFVPWVTYGTMDVIPQVPEGDTSPTARFYAVVTALDITDEVSSQRFVSDFTLGLYLLDPRIYFLGLAVDQTSIYPLSVTNPGNAPIDPVLHVAGASGTVTVSDGTHTLTFINTPSGTLDIDFGQRTAKVGSTPVALDVANSDWWDNNVDGIAGDATVTITQTGGTSIRVTFVPAVWG